MVRKMWNARTNERPINEDQYENQNYQRSLNGNITTDGYEVQQNNGTQEFQHDQISFLQLQQEWQKQVQEQRNTHTEFSSQRNAHPEFSSQRNTQQEFSSQRNTQQEFSSQRNSHQEVSSHFQNCHITPQQMHRSGGQPKTYEVSKNNRSNRNCDTGYSSLEMLTDAVATMILMPKKLERTSNQIVENFNKVNDIETLSNLAQNLLEKCSIEIKFLPIAGHFCHYLAKNVRHNLHFIFCELLVKNLQEILTNHVQLIYKNSIKFRQLTMFSTDLYVKFVNDMPPISDLVQDSKTTFNEKEVKHVLSSLLYQLYKSALTIGRQDNNNVTMVIDMLKLSGKLLEVSGQPMTGIFDEVEKIIQDMSRGSNSSFEVRDSLIELVQIRARDWFIEESKKPTLFDVSKPTSSVSLERPNAVKIVHPLDGNIEEHVGNYSNGMKERESLTNDPNFTEDELQFMNEAIEARSIEKMMNEEGDDGNHGGRMPAEVEAAFEDFLNEQQAVLPRLQS